METVDLSIIPDKTSPAIHTSQYDEGRVKRFMLYDGPCPYTLSGNEAIELRIRKPNNQTEIIEVENSGDDYIDLTLTNQITDVAGDVYCKFRIDDISTKGFYIKVEPGPARIYTRYADGEIAEFETDLVEDIIKLDVDFKPIQDLHGYNDPWAPGCGKNLLNMTAESGQSGQRYTATGVEGNITLESIGTYGRVGFVVEGLTIGETYTFYADIAHTVSSSQNSSIYFNDAIGWQKSYGQLNIGTTISESSPFTKTIVATSTTLFIGFYITAANAYGDTIVVKNAQVEKGSFATAWAPYSNICPISGHDSVQLFRTGKNLITANVPINRQYWGTSQSDIISALNTLPVGTYTISNKFKVNELPSNGKVEHGNIYITAMVNGSQTPLCPHNTYVDNSPSISKIYNESVSFTITEEVKGNINHAYLYCDRQGTHTGTGRGKYDFYDLQLELGSAATDYEPYTGTEVTVQFGQTVYGGVIDYTAHIIRVVSKLVKISDYTWTKDPSWGYFKTGVNDMERNPESSKKLEGLMSEAYVNRNAAQAGSQRINNSIAAWTNQLRVRDNTYDNVTDFVNAMGDTHFLYPLKTPFEIPFSGYTPIPTLNGKNIVYSDAGDVHVGYHTTKQ